MRRRTTSLDAGAATVYLLADDVTNKLTSIEVNNSSTNSVWIAIPDGETFVVGPKTNTALIMKVPDRQLIEQKSNGARLGRPFRLAYPWSE